MIYVAIEPIRNSDEAAPVGGNTGRNNGLYAVGAAVAPTQIGLAAPRPDDSDSFWEANSPCRPGCRSIAFSARRERHAGC